MLIKATVFLFLAGVLSGCSELPQKNDDPIWTRAAARSVENGYIVYTSRGEASNLEQAQFRAEGLALEDLANECSLIPKGTRIEDRFVTTNNKMFTAYIKIGLEFQVCETAKKTIEPEEIKALASTPFAEQLRKYQDLVENGEVSKQAEAVNPPEEYSAPPMYVAGSDSNMHFYATRQYIAYQKQIVILSAPQFYQPGSPEHLKFVTAVSPIVQQVQMAERQNPSLVNRPVAWSSLHDRPRVLRPPSLTSALRTTPVQRREMRPMRNIQHPNRERQMRQRQGVGRAPITKNGRRRKRKYKDLDN